MLQELKDLKTKFNDEEFNKLADSRITELKAQQVSQVKSKKINLAKKEFELLFFLCQHPNKIFNRDEILKKVWGTDVFVVSRTVDVHIRKIREKVGEELIKTVKGIGYKFVGDE